MRASAASRASRSFQTECCPLPPLLPETILATLRSDGVEVIGVQEEADGAVAQLAEQTSGLAVSQDSDFHILTSRGSGKARYAPLDTFEYLIEEKRDTAIDQAEAAGEASAAADEADDGFQTAKTSRRNRSKKGDSRQGQGISSQTRGPNIGGVFASSRPPSRESVAGAEYKLKAVRLRAYSSHAIAARLRIPPPLLPLLASVVGNDYTTDSQEHLLLSHISTYPERVQEVAEVVRDEWHRSMGHGKQVRRSRPSPAPMNLEARLSAKKAGGLSMTSSLVDDDARSDYSAASSATATPAGRAPTLKELDQVAIDPVRALVVATVDGLLQRNDAALRRNRHVGDADKEACVQSIIDSIAAYTLLTHDHGTSQSLIRPSNSDTTRTQAIERYEEAFQTVKITPDIMGVMAFKRVLPQLAPEDPDLKTVQVGASRQVRGWMYGVLFDVYGMDWARQTMEEPVQETPEGVVFAQEDKEDASTQSNGRAKYGPGEKPDDIVSVDTESSDSSYEVDLVTRPSSVLGDRPDEEQPEPVKPPPAVTEYVRKGTSLVGDLVSIRSIWELLRQCADRGDAVPASLASLLGQYEAAKSEKVNGNDAPIADPLPPLLVDLPVQTRLDLYRMALSSGDAAMESVPLHLLPLAVAVRHIISSIALDYGESKKRFNWTRAEVVSAVRTGCQAWRIHQGSAPALPREDWVKAPSTRAIHVCSTLQLVLDSAHDLAMSLLLFPNELPSPYLIFDGPLFHLLHENSGNASEAMHLSEQVKQEAQGLVKVVLAEGREDDLAVSAQELKQQRKDKKRKEKTESNVEQPANGGRRSNGGAGGVFTSSANAFAMLGDG